jgi:hypothetical protein
MSENLVEASTQETAPSESVEITQEVSTEQEPSWYWGEGVPGQGDKPEWMSDKYKSVQDQARGYSELMKLHQEKMGGFVGAPEEGYALPEGLEEESPLLNMLTEIGSKYNMNQDMFNELVEQYDSVIGKIQEEAMQQKEGRIKEELGKLGENAKARLSNIADYAKANFDEDGAEELINMATTAKGVEILEKLINANKPSRVADPSKTAPMKKDAMEEMRSMQFATNEQGQRLIDIDPHHRAKYRELVSQLSKGA